MNLTNKGQMDRGNENSTQHLPWWLRKTTNKPQSCWSAPGFEPGTSRMRYHGATSLGYYSCLISDASNTDILYNVLKPAFFSAYLRTSPNPLSINVRKLPHYRPLRPTVDVDAREEVGWLVYARPPLPRYSFYRMLSRPQDQCGHEGVKKISTLPTPGIELGPSSLTAWATVHILFSLHVPVDTSPFHEAALYWWYRPKMWLDVC